MSGEDVLKLLDDSDDSESDSDISSDKSDEDTIISDENETDLDDSDTQSSQPVVKPVTVDTALPSYLSVLLWNLPNHLADNAFAWFIVSLFCVLEHFP